MTAHKHFKQLVRARMSKTGESYTNSRRHVLRQAEIAPASKGPARFHLPGNIPATTALRIVLTAAGVTDPRTHQPLSEAMLFAIAGGIGIGVAAFHYEKGNFSSFYVAGRHMWQDDAGYLKAALKRFGIEPVIRESGGVKAAEKQLRDALAGGAPVIAWVDMTHLPHRAMPQEFSGMLYHLVTVYSIDDERGCALIGDLADEPVEIPLSDLAIARARIKSQKHRLMSIAPAAGPADLVPLIRSGLKACHAGLTGKPVKGPAAMGTFEALKRWAISLGGTDKQSWHYMFPRGHLLWQGLNFIHEFIECYHTGGGLCRALFAESLAEAAEYKGMEKLRAVSQRYADLAAAWTDLAHAALPTEVPAFREARELRHERAELTASGTSANRLQITSKWQRLAELRHQAHDNFPLSQSECDVLVKGLQKRVQSLHEAELQAHRALFDAAPS